MEEWRSKGKSFSIHGGTETCNEFLFFLVKSEIKGPKMTVLGSMEQMENFVADIRGFQKIQETKNQVETT